MYEGHVRFSKPGLPSNAQDFRFRNKSLDIFPSSVTFFILVPFVICCIFSLRNHSRLSSPRSCAVSVTVCRLPVVSSEWCEAQFTRDDPPPSSPSLARLFPLFCFMCVVRFLEVSMFQTLGAETIRNLFLRAGGPHRRTGRKNHDLFSRVNVLMSTRPSFEMFHL